MLFERWNPGEFKQPREYPAEALATFNTHDLPTFRGWMSGHDLAVKQALGVNPGENEGGREHARGGLRHALSQVGSGHDFAGAASFLAKTPARLVMVAAEDVLDVADQVNIPGTIDQHPNWRRKLPIPIEDWHRQPIFKNVIAAFAHAGRNTASC